VPSKGLQLVSMHCMLQKARSVMNLWVWYSKHDSLL
jgi:hypothetical protein